MIHHNSLRFTHPPLCLFENVASLQRASGLPLGGFIEPFLEPMTNNAEDTLASSVGRCRCCSAYVNAYCSFLRTGWVCSLCQTLNEFADGCNARYMGGLDHRDTLPELRGNIVDLYVDVDGEVGWLFWHCSSITCPPFATTPITTAGMMWGLCRWTRLQGR